MEIKVSEELIIIYKKNNKNWNYAIDFLLNSIDPFCYKDTFKIFKELELEGEKINIEIITNVAERIKKDFDYIDSELVETLMWIALMFPEV